MFNTTLSYSCQSLVGTNKVGTLKKNANGYYEMIVGALGVYNSAGAFYPVEASRDMFENRSGSLQRRLEHAALRGEYGHPKPPPKPADEPSKKIWEEEFVRRNLSIYEENVCVHHRRIWLDFDSLKDKDGKPLCAIMSELIPNGPRGEILEKQLQNPHENVCFSIRSFTDNVMRFGIQEKIIREVVTFDYVNEPGITYARKYFSPSLEEYNGMDVSRGLIERAVFRGEECGIVATESAVVSATAIYNAMGWELPNNSRIIRPSLAW